MSTKVYLPAYQKVEDFLSTLEDIAPSGSIKTRAVIEVECTDASMAKFLATIDPDENGKLAVKSSKRRSKKTVTEPGADEQSS